MHFQKSKATLKLQVWLVACANYWRLLTGTAQVSRENVAQNTHRQPAYADARPWGQIRIRVKSRNWGCLVTWFCYQLIVNPGKKKKASISWPDPFVFGSFLRAYLNYLENKPCSKLNKKSCQSCCLESQIINIKLKKSLKIVPSPPPKLSTSGWWTGSNLEHWKFEIRVYNLHLIENGVFVFEFFWKKVYLTPALSDAVTARRTHFHIQITMHISLPIPWLFNNTRNC